MTFKFFKKVLVMPHAKMTKTQVLSFPRLDPFSIFQKQLYLHSHISQRLVNQKIPLNFKVSEFRGDQLVDTWSQSESVQVPGIKFRSSGYQWRVLRIQLLPCPLKDLVKIEDGTVGERNHCHCQCPYSIFPCLIE